MQFNFLKEYAPAEADILLWFGKWTFRNILARIFAGAQFFQVSMLSATPSKGIYYNYEQNMDMVSETPRPIHELLANSSYKQLVLRPKFEEMKVEICKGPGFKRRAHNFVRDMPTPKHITSAMKEVVWFRYNNIDVIRAVFNKYRKASKIVGCCLDKEGVEFLYYFKENRLSTKDWVLSVDKRNTFTCSGAVATAFALNGIQLFDKLPWFVLPDDFVKCRYFSRIGCINSSTKILYQNN